MATRRALTVLLAIACVAAALVEEPGKAEDTSDAEITAEEIFANPLDDDAYVMSSRCLSTGKYRRVEIMNNQILIFHGRGDNIWLNVLPNRCLGLQPDMILRIESAACGCAPGTSSAASRGFTARRTPCPAHWANFTRCDRRTLPRCVMRSRQASAQAPFPKPFARPRAMPKRLPNQTADRQQLRSNCKRAFGARYPLNRSASSRRARCRSGAVSSRGAMGSPTRSSLPMAFFRW